MSDLGPMRTIPFNEDKARDLACQGVWTVTRIGETNLVPSLDSLERRFGVAE